MGRFTVTRTGRDGDPVSSSRFSVTRKSIPKKEDDKEKEKKSSASFLSSLPAYQRAYSAYTAPKTSTQTFSFPSSSKTPTTTQNIGTGALKAELADRRASGSYAIPGSHEDRLREIEVHIGDVRKQLQSELQSVSERQMSQFGGIGEKDNTKAQMLNLALSNLAQEATQESFLADIDRLSTRTTGRPGNISLQDFLANSKYVPTGTGENAEFNAATGIYSSTGFGDITYDYINKNPKAVEMQDLQDIQLGHSVLGLDQSYLSQMGDNEIAMFNYIYNIQGPEAAYSYIDEIKTSLTARNRAEEEAMWRSMTRESPADTAGMSVFSVLTSPAKGLSYIGQLADYAADGTIDQNAGTNRLSYINSAIRSEASDIVETNWGAPGSFFYNTGMSMADFLYSTALSGGFGAAPGTAAAKASSGLALAIMGSGAAADTVIASKDRGLSDDQAFALGTIAGLAEIATEKFSLDALLKDPKNAVLFVLQNAGVEASEETASSLINLFADIAISKNKSEWQTSINDYISQGYSENEAFGKAFADQAKSIGLDALGGALSGGVLSGARVGANAVYNRVSGTQAVDAGSPIIQNQNATDTEAQRQTQTDPLQALAEEMAAKEAEEIFPTVEERPRPKPQKAAVVSERQQQETVPEPSWKKYTGAPRADGTDPAAQARTAARRAAESADLASMSTDERESFLQAYDMGRSGESFEADVSSLHVQSDAVYGAFFQGQDDYFNGNADRYQAYRTRETSAEQATQVETPVQESRQISQAEAEQAPSESMPVETPVSEQTLPKPAQEAVGTMRSVTPGFVQTEYSKNLSKKESAALDNLAKAAGVSIQIDAETGEGGANGWYENGVVHIAADAENPALVVAKHEITHSLKESAPEAYQKYRDYIVSEVYSGDDIIKIVNQYQQYYKQSDISLTYDQALDEIAADFTEAMVNDPGKFAKLAQKNKSVATKAFNAARTFFEKLKGFISGDAASKKGELSKIYGVTLEQLEKATSLWEKALESTSKLDTSRKRGSKSYSQKGSSDKLKNVEESNIENPSNGLPYVNTLSYRGYSDKSPMSRAGYAMFTDNPNDAYYKEGDKGRALYAVNHSVLTPVSDIIPKIESAINEAIEDGTLPYELEYLEMYDIGDLAEQADPPDIVDSAGLWDNEDIVGFLFNQTDIMDDITGIKTSDGAIVFDESVIMKIDGSADIIGIDAYDTARYQQKNSGDILKENAALKRQNQSLKERLEYYKGQTKRTAQRSEDPKAVRKAASGLIKEYGSTADVDHVTAGLQTLFDYMGGKEVSYSESFDMAREVGRLIVENSVEVNDDLYQEYKDLREYIRSAKLSISPEDRSGIPDYNEFRKHNFGRMTLRSGPTNIDQYYIELSESYPEFFNETREITPEDQLLKISEVLDRIYEITESNPFSFYMDRAVDGVAGEIMETFFQLPQTKKTFADIQAEKLDSAKAKGRQKLQELRTRSAEQQAQIRAKDRKKLQELQQQSRERLELMRKQNKERLEKLRKREQETRARQAQKLKETYSAREAAGKDRRRRAELRRKITRHANALSQKLLHPTDINNIPESLRSAVGAALSSINQESRYTIDPDTGKRIYEKDDSGYREKGTPTKRSAAFAKLKTQYIDAIKNGENLVIDPSLLGDYKEGFQGNFDALISMGDIKLSDMTAEQLQTVWQTVRAIEHAVSTYGKMLSHSKFKSTQEAAYSAKRDGSRRKERKGPLPKRVSLSIENPYTFFCHLGDTGKSIFRSLRNAQDHQELMSREVAEKSSEIASRSTVDKLEKEVHRFTVSGGQKLTLSTDQVMELYELMQREQARDHLLKGGIMQPEVKKAKVKRGSESIRLTAEDLADIVSVLTEDQIKIADSLQRLMSGMLAEYGNQASMKVYGYEKFNEPHYWPIKSAPEGVQTTVEKGSGKTRSIKNIGMAKSVVQNAANPLELFGVFNTFSTHTADMVDYAAWLAPMEDMNRLFNFRFRDQEGNLTGVTFKSILDGAGGKGSQQYWTNLMEDIQNGISQPGDDTLTNIAAKGVGAFKGAAVGGNLRVVIQQPTAFFRASAVLSLADMAKGLVKGATKGNGWKKALKYSPIAMRKADGGFDISSPTKMKEILFGSRTKLEAINDVLSAPAGMADAVTWGKLWNACEWQVARENKSLRKGSDAFYKKVNEVFSDMIDQTQVVDGVLQRSNIMRSSNALAQQATSFMGEPIMSLNMTMRAYDDLRYTKDPKQRGKAIKHFGRTATALVVTSAINALAQSIVDGWRDDDKDKKYWDRVLSAFTGQTGDEESAWDKATAIIFEGNFVGNLNPIGQVPFVKDVWSIIQGYDVSRTDMEVVADLVESGQKVIDSFAGEKKRTKAYAVKEMFSAGAKLFGIPFSNIARDVWGIARSIAIETESIPVQYEMEKVIYNLSSSSNKSRFLDLAFQALSSGDMDTYNHISDDLMNNMGVPGEDITSGMKSRYNSAVKKDPEFQISQEALDLIGVRKKYDVQKEEKKEVELSPEQYKKYSAKKAEEYRKMEDGLEGSRAFDDLDNATKNSALSSIEDLAEEIAMEAIAGGEYEYSSEWMENVDDAEDVGLEPWEYILFRAVYNSTKGSKDEDGNDIEGETKSDKIREWLEDQRGLTEKQREFLWSTEYKSEW